ncbi:restriction endonuclease [Vibrio breoganii]|uniref:MrcB family domain-containing protein n=1 Tax=Vibrio breoganii TaxID=553239 RepID=UPI000C858785|nr:DUF3578 domain-containing protein [Vibrio breoganii]PMG33485.1 restriction endonuclease [Vibrio breoganii]PMG82879.1 restriction endonuclease [Vibrio breoganii]PML85141.1 restriction endonuclease [Vibrio breoganii]PMM52757.1 restriction endonuclease [Vibrio breoganii]PMM80808.1 restriction endonuclease [Vibrio breoganii]
MSLKELFGEIATNWVKAKNEAFSQHPIANLLRKDLKEEVKRALNIDDLEYSVKASAGAGGWADVPWISILRSATTTSTQSGVYPVYLFRADGTGVYLSLGFGTTELTDKYGKAEAKVKSSELRARIRAQDSRLNQWDDVIDLRATTPLAKSYEWASAGAKFYSTIDLPENAEFVADAKELLDIYASIDLDTPPSAAPKRVESTSFSGLSKPFLLLAGISGTGKTRFVRKQVEGNIGSLNENYCLTSVRPDWHEPSDLLGYVSRLGEKVHYVTTDVLMFIAKAWRAMVDAGLSIQEEELQGKGKYLTVTGERDTLNQMLPYWLCLDEMNLAPVEQYFADYLSVIETREWKWQGEGFTYTCDPILKPATIKQVDEKDLREALELSGVKYDAVWELICQHGMSIPLNLIVAGTVNMDETTHGFSRKVIDRALTIDFGEFFPNNIDEFFESKTQAKVLGFPTLSHAKLEHFQSVEADNRASKTQHFFQSINKVLLGTPFELAFRAFNELSLSVVSISPKNEVELAAVFDDFMMCKVLPRIEGDEDKLLDNEQNNLLEQLIEVLESQFESILLDLQRPDLFRELIDAPEKPIDVPCRSLKKLQAMNRTLENGFTSFWP